MQKIIGILVCTLLLVVTVLPVTGTMNKKIIVDDFNPDKTSFQVVVKFTGSDFVDDGLTEFYNDLDSEDVILARSLVASTDWFYIVPPGHWIDFFEDGNVGGSASFDHFDASILLSPTTQTWTVTEVYKIKYGSDPNASWDNFGSYVKVGDKLKTCRYWWFEDSVNSYMKFTKADGSKWKIGPDGRIFVTAPHHIPNDPIFLNINGFFNFADCNYGVVETVNHTCEVEGDTIVKPDYQPGYQGSYGEAFIPQRYDGPHPPHKPSTPSGPPSGSPGTSYTYSSYAIDPNGDGIFYLFDWDDSTTSEWFGPFPSGETVSESHAWSEKGTYAVKVKAKDTTGLESEWSDPLPIEMPRNKPFNYNFNLLDWLFEQFPNAFPLLRYILGLQ